jgi:hypothetical protein
LGLGQPTLQWSGASFDPTIPVMPRFMRGIHGSVSFAERPRQFVHRAMDSADKPRYDG